MALTILGSAWSKPADARMAPLHEMSMAPPPPSATTSRSMTCSSLLRIMRFWSMPAIGGGARRRVARRVDERDERVDERETTSATSATAAALEASAFESSKCCGNLPYASRALARAAGPPLAQLRPLPGAGSYAGQMKAVAG